MRKLMRVTTPAEKKRKLRAIPVRPLRPNYLFRDDSLLSVEGILAIIQVLRSYDLTI
jgi:hypothetical protein